MAVAATKYLLLRSTIYSQASIAQIGLGSLRYWGRKKVALIAMTVIKQRCEYGGLEGWKPGVYPRNPRSFLQSVLDCILRLHLRVIILDGFYGPLALFKTDNRISGGFGSGDGGDNWNSVQHGGGSNAAFIRGWSFMRGGIN